MAITAIALVTGMLFGLSVVNLTIESPYHGDWIRALILVALAGAVPAVAGFGIARATELHGFAFALNRSYSRRLDWLEFLLAILFAVSVATTIHVALSLIVDPRYQDFHFAALSPIAIAFAILAFTGKSRSKPGLAEIVATIVLFVSALFIVANEGVHNWQALWVAGLLILLSLACLRVRVAPG